MIRLTDFNIVITKKGMINYTLEMHLDFNHVDVKQYKVINNVPTKNIHVDFNQKN